MFVILKIKLKHRTRLLNYWKSFAIPNIYTNPKVKSEDSKARELIAFLFDYFVKHPDKMPEFFKNNMKNEPVERCVCDFIAGMTDRHAIEVYKEIYIPNVWSGGK